MTNSYSCCFNLLLISSLLITALSTVSTVAFTVDHHVSNWTAVTGAEEPGCCRGAIGDGMAGDQELDVDNSEINRRILATTDYISYDALQRGSVPCSRRGNSYYNCQPGAEANPYTRGCTAITRCRSE